MARNGTAHIEIRAVRRPGAEPLAHDVEHMLQSLNGVQWADVDAVLGRVIVAFDGGSVELDDLVDVVEAVEEAHGVHDERFGHDRPDHPADHVLSQRALAEVIADTAGLGLSVFGSVLRMSPLPVEVAGVVSLIDGSPRLRRILEERLGPPVTDMGLAFTNAVAQSLASGPLTLVTDLLHRVNEYTATRAAEQCWDSWEADVLRHPGAARRPPVEHRPRPARVPRGPVERYSDSAGLAALVGRRGHRGGHHRHRAQRRRAAGRHPQARTARSRGLRQPARTGARRSRRPGGRSAGAADARSRRLRR